MSKLPIDHRFVIQALKDRVNATGCSVPEIVDQALVAYLFPQHETAAMWVAQLYQDGNLAKAYSCVFDYASKRLGELDITPLITNFSHLIASHLCHFSGKEPEFGCLLRHIEAICRLLPLDDPWHDAQLCDTLLHQLRNDPTAVWAADISNLINRNIGLLQSTSNTYCILSNIAIITAPTLPNTPITRMQYIKTLAHISADW